MKIYHLLIVFLCFMLITACKPPAAPTDPPNIEEPAGNTPADVPEEPPPPPQGVTIFVTSTEDSGPGTLRQALQDAQDGDTITFDKQVFPPYAPATIFITSGELPHLRANYLTIDASYAGVILDGSQYEGWAAMQIVSGQGSKVMGLQISHFPGPAIAISGGTSRLTIGGDRNIGTGPFGQGNLICSNSNGIDINGHGTDISIVGNLIGTDMSRTTDLGNWSFGISIYESTQDITIGPDNMIAYNLDGIKIANQIGEAVTITQNQIFGNESHQIWMMNLSQGLPAPTVYDFDLLTGSMSGSACPDCTIEIFSDSNDGGEIFEGSTQADEDGNFRFNKGSAFDGPNLTLTATDPNGKTSLFSYPVSGPGRTIVMQLENNFPTVPVINKPFNQLPYSHIGVWFEATTDSGIQTLFTRMVSNACASVH